MRKFVKNTQFPKLFREYLKFEFFRSESFHESVSIPILRIRSGSKDSEIFYKLDHPIYSRVAQMEKVYGIFAPWSVLVNLVQKNMFGT